MPILLAFYNNGDIKSEITDRDVYESMYDFYSNPSNAVDMLKDKKTENYETWDENDYLKLAKRNPIRNLAKTHSEFFKIKDNSALALSDDLKYYINLETFKKHFKDIIEYRTVTYYKSRFEDRK